MCPAIHQLRAEVMAQPADDRVDYALSLLSFYLDPLPAFYDGVDRMGLRLAARDVRILYALDRRRGRYLTRDALQAAAMIDVPRAEWGGPETISRRVAEIRRKLNRSRFPVSLRVWSGVGYILDAPADFQFEGVPAREIHA